MKIYQSNFFRKIVALMSVIVLVISSVPFSARAEEPEESFTTLTMSDFGLSDNTINGITVAGNALSGTLDGIAIEGVYNFGGTIDRGNMVYFGGAQNAYRGFYIKSTAGGTNLEVGQRTGATFTSLGVITPAASEETLTKTDVRIKIGFTYVAETEETADVKVSIKINDTYEVTYTMQSVDKTTLNRCMMVHAEPNHTLGYKSYVAPEPDSPENPEIPENPETPEEPEASFTTLTLSDFGLNDQEINGIAVAGNALSGTLDGIAIEGIYNFGGTIDRGNMVYFGGAQNQYRGFYIKSTAGGTNLEVGQRTGATFTSLGVITPEASQETLTKTDVRIKIGFTYLEETTTTADVRVDVTINDKYAVSYTMEEVDKTTLNRCMLISSEANNPLSYKSYVAEEPEISFTTLPLSAFGFVDNTINGIAVAGNALSGTLDGIAIEGIYNFGGTIDRGNEVYFGGAQGQYRGFYIKSTQGGTNLEVGQRTGATFTSLGVITPEASEETLTKTNVRIKIGFTYVAKTTTTADVKVDVTINNTYAVSYTMEAVDKTLLNRCMLVSSVADHPLSYQSCVTEEPDNPGEPENPENPNPPEQIEIRKPDLTKITMKQLGITNGLYQYAGTSAFAVQGSRKSSLMNTELSQKMTFSNHAENYIMYGGQDDNAWRAIRIWTSRNNELYIAAPNVATEKYTITAAEAGVETFTGVELEIKLELFANQNQPEDAVLGLYINGKLCGEKYMTFTGAADKLGKYVSFLLVNEEGWVQIGDIEPAPTIDESFTKLTFNSYGIMSGLYTYNFGKVAVSGHCERENMDKVVFSDTIHFSKEIGAQLQLGGKATEWLGMVWRATEDGYLYVYENAIGKQDKFAPMYFKPEVAGVELVGRDVELTLSFEYVDSDEDGEKDDVKLGVWFDGVAYANRWIYLQNFAPDLGGYIGIYSPSVQSSLAIKTELVPIDFEEFGFTRNWLLELRINLLKFIYS